MAHRFTAVSILALSVLLSACGGGGGSSSAPTPIPTPPPVLDTASPTVSFAAETGTVESGGTLTSAISAADNVGVTVGPNVTCTNGGTYSGDVFTAPEVTVETQSVCTATAEDAAGNSASATLTVTVTPPPDTEAPTISFAAETATVGTGGTLTSAITVTDNIGVTVGPNVTCTNGGTYSGDVFTAPEVTVETQSVCTATAEDAAGNSASATLTVTVTPPPNEAPTFSGTRNFTIAENQPFSTGITVTDVDDDDVSVQIRGGRDAQFFSYDPSTNMLELNRSLAGRQGRNFEDPRDVGVDNVYEVEMMARDNADNLVVEVYSLTITDVDEGLALTGKIALVAGPETSDTTYQRNLASFGDWSGDGFSDLMITLGVFSSSQTTENIFLLSGQDVFDTADSTYSVDSQENGIRFFFSELEFFGGPDSLRLMSARPIPDLTGDGLMDIYFTISGDRSAFARRGFILDSAKLIPIFDNGDLTLVDILNVEAEGFGIEILPQGTAEDVANFFDDLEFIPDMTADGRHEALICQDVLDPLANAEGTEKRRSLIIGSEAISSALAAGESLTFNIDTTAAPVAQPNLVFVDTQNTGSGLDCAQSLGDFEGDGRNDLLIGGSLSGPDQDMFGNHVVWGTAVSNLMATGGTLSLETLTATGDSIVFTGGTASPLGDLDANGLAEMLVLTFRSAGDPSPIFDRHHIFGATPDLLARFPDGIIDVYSLFSPDRGRRTAAFGIRPNSFTQYFADGEPLDFDNDGHLDWQIRSDFDESFAISTLHVEPTEVVASGLSAFFDAPISTFIRFGEFNLDNGNVAYAKDVTGDGGPDLLSSYRGQPFIVAGDIFPTIMSGTFLDVPSLFPELYSRN